MPNAILVLNAGSSSLKFALYEADTLVVLCRGEIEEIGRAELKVSGPLAGELNAFGPPPSDPDREVTNAWVVAALRELPDITLVAAGHRVVHGGARFKASVLLDAATIEALRGFIPLAPDHQPYNLAVIETVGREWPHLPQIGCFDTAFHRTQPRLAEIFALPRALTDEGILRYGFHGISYQYIASTLPQFLGARASGRIIMAHLGNGASLCAYAGGKSVATTMGFTTIDGLMMGTRSGAIDPGVVLHLINQKGMSAKEVGDILNERSGLLGVSGLASDVRSLESSSDSHAAEALDLFAYRVIRESGSLIAAMGGLDAFVFTAGIGEHSARMREAICKGLGWMGVALDRDRNQRSDRRISAETSKIDVLVIPTDEELEIALDVRRLICNKVEASAPCN
ncbi:MAG: acetate/propionate family kinase [Beijerinckiaceae bacterium]